MVSTVLDGPWRAWVADDGLRRGCIEFDFDDSTWPEIPVPGHWAELTELASRRTVLYRTKFERSDDATGGPESRHWLAFDGIWQSGDVWFDGDYLGPTDGWFVGHEFEVTEQINARRDHVAVVEVSAPPNEIEGPTRQLQGIFGDTSIVGHRHRGGIWRPVRLVSTGAVRMTKNRVLCSHADPGSATVHFRTHLMSEQARPVTIVTTLRPPGGGAPITNRRRQELATGATVLEWDLVVPDPALWWPHELGDQPLYRATVSVETTDGQISDIWDRTLGLRSIEMRDWILRVNGRRIFARGADLWPTAALPAAAAGDSIANDVALAAELGLNLLRVESHVARPELYDAADRLGMMLWQDLPMRGEVKRSIRPTAVEGAHRLVDRLGAHPSIVLWCSHYDPTGTTTGLRPTTALPSRRALFGVAKQQVPTWTKSVLDRLVGRAFGRADRSRPVVQGSGTWPSAPQFDGTDTHLRFGWNSGSGRDLESFARSIPRMVRWVSSLGAQSIPNSDDVQVDWPADLHLLSERYGARETGFRQYVSPDDHVDAQSFVAASQAYQATLLRRQIETLRRLKYRPTGGFTFAALADSRPAISFAIYDHDRDPKEAVGAVRAACRAVIVVADRLPVELRVGDAVLLDVHVVSDRRDPLDSLEVRADLTWAGGKHHWGWTGAVAADDVARVGSINWIVPDSPGPVELHLSLLTDGIEIADNHYSGHID